MSESIKGKPDFISLDPPELLTAESRENREQNWLRMSEYFRTVTDRAGTPIDEKVFETVVGLNLNGVKTNASDEGHAEFLHAYPWIQFSMPDDRELAQLVDELDARTDELYASDPEQAELGRLMEEYVTRKEALDTGRGKVFQQVVTLLSAFYFGKQIEDWGKILSINAPEWMIEPNAASTQPAAEEEQRRQRLAAFQAEMQAFGRFLHQRYVDGSGDTPTE